MEYYLLLRIIRTKGIGDDTVDRCLIDIVDSQAALGRGTFRPCPQGAELLGVAIEDA